MVLGVFRQTSLKLISALKYQLMFQLDCKIDLYYQVKIYLSDLYTTPPQTYDRIRSTLQYSLVQGLSVFDSCMRRSHPLPDQLPGDHASDLVAAFSMSTYGNSTLFLYLPYCTYLQYNTYIQHILNQVEVWWLDMFQQSTHVLLCTPIIQT